jgi:predicted PurR-regulated permease PerM
MPEENITTNDRLTTVLSYGALLLLCYLVFLIAESFLAPLAWAAILAIFFYPLHRWYAGRMGPNRAALASTLTVTCALIAPTILVAYYTAQQAITAAAHAQSLLAQPGQPAAQHILGWVHGRLPEAWRSANYAEALRSAAAKAASFLATRLADLLRNLVAFVIGLFVTTFAMFFMFRDAQSVVRAVRHLLPFSEPTRSAVLSESHDLIFASVAVGLIVAVMQGALGGTAFLLAGIHTAIFWGVVIALFSLVPVVGSALIWAPAALWIGVSGHWGKALLIVAICGGVAGVADNIVRPLLLRNRTHLNELMVFIGVLGGLGAFGLLGLVIGPTILAVAVGTFRVYMDSREAADATAANPAASITHERG